MKNKISSFLTIFGFSLVLMTVTGCSNNSSATKEQNNGGGELKKDAVRKEVENIVYPLPTSFELAEMLNRIEASFIISLTNEPSNVDKYFTEKSKALNLGIYSADLSYSSTYNQKQQTIDFMNASRRLIEELDMADAVDADIVEKIEANENNKEGLVELISDSFNDTYQYLNENNRAGISILVVAGTYIEGLYIATHISDDTFSNKEIVSIIMKQKEPLIKLVDVLKQHDSDDNVKEVVADVNRLYALYNSVGTGSITEEQLKLIAVEVAAIRTKIVQ